MILLYNVNIFKTKPPYDTFARIFRYLNKLNQVAKPYLHKKPEG